ncbi:HAAS signaling domain-containing protein [Gudongella sp. DL1XJH-153]|uniref:HAAS signaling domain-containing protein n=1 Tax=Gudongella sp. DL1XJH-153 TaxID=3409804 RepID=UPI003BB7B4FB
MIKNYLYAIGKYLPPSQRDDILKNVEANIYEYLEENYGKREYTENEIADALYNMGNPKKVAQSYLDKPRYLIGPQYIDTYLLVVKIALLGISIGMAVVSIIKFIADGNLIMSLLSFLGGLWNGGLVAVGIVTIIFSLVERYDDSGSSPFDDKDEKWSLESLDSPPEATNRVKVTDLIFESIFILLFLAFLNHGSALPRIYEDITFVFINYEALAPYILWINLTLGLSLLLNLYLLIKRSWNIVTRLLSIALDLAGIGIFAILALTPNLMDFSDIPGLTQEEILGIETGVNLGLKIGLAAIIVITLIEVFKHFRAIFRKR